MISGSHLFKDLKTVKKQITSACSKLKTSQILEISDMNLVKNTSLVFNATAPRYGLICACISNVKSLLFNLIRGRIREIFQSIVCVTMTCNTMSAYHFGYYWLPYFTSITVQVRNTEHQPLVHRSVQPELGSLSS